MKVAILLFLGIYLARDVGSSDTLVCSKVICTVTSAFNLDASGAVRNECCAYFRSDCCSATENDFLRIMFYVTIASGAGLFCIMVVGIIACFCCTFCCGMAWERRRLRAMANSLRRPRAMTNSLRRPLRSPRGSPVRNCHVIRASNGPTGSLSRGGGH